MAEPIKEKNTLHSFLILSGYYYRYSFALDEFKAASLLAEQMNMIGSFHQWFNPDQNVRSNQLQSSIPLLQSNDRGHLTVVDWFLYSDPDYIFGGN